MFSSTSSASLLRPIFDKAERRRVFEILDQDRDGQISFKELQDGLLHGLKVPTNRAFVKRMMDQADTDNDGFITFEEFDRYMAAREEALETVFNTMDTDSDGRLSADEVAAGLRQLGHTFSTDDIRFMFSKVDKDGDGAIEFEEFQAFFLHTPLGDTSEILEFWRKPALVTSNGTVKEIVVPPNCTADKGYVLCRFIDSGAFGEVCLVTCQETGREFAIKRFSSEDAKVLQQFHEERDFLARVQKMGGCRKLVSLHESFVADDMSCLVLSYCAGGNLQDFIDAHVLTPDAAAFYAAEAAEAIREIHSLGYVHRDIKAENFLMDARGRLKLCDFGSCFAVSEDGHVRTELHVGTPDYMAPEFLAAKRRRGDAFTQSIDWWALGCLTFTMVYGYLPFASDSPFHTESLILTYKESLHFPSQPDAPDDAKSFMSSLLCDASERMGFDDIRAHPFMSRADWALVADDNQPVHYATALPARAAPAVAPPRAITKPAAPMGSRPRPPPPMKFT